VKKYSCDEPDKPKKIQDTVLNSKELEARTMGSWVNVSFLSVAIVSVHNVSLNCRERRTRSE